MITPVLILNGKLSAAISLKQALERNARYEVHPFTTLDAAVDFLREHPQDAVLVDTASLRAPAEQIVGMLREAQPDVHIVIAPRPQDSVMKAMEIQAALDESYSARQVMNAIESLLSGSVPPSLPAQNDGKTGMLEHVFDDAPPSPTTLPEYGTLEEVLQDMGLDSFGYAEDHDEDSPTPHDPQSHGSDFHSALNHLSPDDDRRSPRTDFDDLVESLRREQPSPRSRMSDFIIRGGIDQLLQDFSDDPSVKKTVKSKDRDKYTEGSLRTHDRLAREEPPMPGFEEAGTVSDLVAGVHDKGFQKVLSILRGDDVTEESSDSILAHSGDFDYGEGSRSQVIDPPARPNDSYDFESVPAAGGDSDEEVPARVVLEQTLERALRNFSIEDLLNSIEERVPGSMPQIKPLPAHVREDAERRWRAAMMAEAGVSPADESALADAPDAPEDVPEGYFTDQTTRPSRGQHFETHPELLETEWLDLPERSHEDTMAFLRGVVPPRSAEPERKPSKIDDPESDVPSFPPLPPESFPEAFPEPTPTPAATPPDSQRVMPFAELVPLEPGEESEWIDLHTEDFNTQFELMAAFELATSEGEPTTGALYTEVTVTKTPELTPAERAAQLALQLMQFSLETTAEAALLVRDGEIVGRAGRMPPEEVASLQPVILAAWNAGRRDARVQFVNLPDTGRDYLLYACRTEEDFLLTLIFKGATSMGDIRRQGNRLVKALMAVPEDLPIPQNLPARSTPPSPTPGRAPTPPTTTLAADPGVLEPFSYVWLLRDPNSYIDAPVAQAISAGMQMQLSEQAWQIHDLQVSEDYVYVYAEVPGESPAFRVVRDLKRRSAEIARAQNGMIQPDSLWADSYLIVTPGRPLDVEEIQQFINFERM